MMNRDTLKLGHKHNLAELLERRKLSAFQGSADSSRGLNKLLECEEGKEESGVIKKSMEVPVAIELATIGRHNRCR